MLSLNSMPRPSKRNHRLASIAPIGGAAKRLKSTLPTDELENQSFLSFSDCEEENDSQWEVDESGDSDVSSNSDDDELKV